MLLAESVTLTLQGYTDGLSRDLPWDIRDRQDADHRLRALERLIRDRRLVLDAIDHEQPVPRDVLERHGWLAVTEARLNVRDAPESWSDERAAATEHAAAEGAQWLESLGIPGPRSVSFVESERER